MSNERIQKPAELKDVLFLLAGIMAKAEIGEVRAEYNGHELIAQFKSAPFSDEASLFVCKYEIQKEN